MSDRLSRTAPRILIVEDEASFASRLAKNLELEGYETEQASDVDSALRFLADQTFDLVIADIRLPGRSGLDLIDLINKEREDGEAIAPPVVMLSSMSDIETVVDAMRRGAADYLTKEATREEIVLRLRNCLQHGRIADEVRRLRRSLDRFQDFNEIIGASSKIQALKVSINEIACNDVTVLITGETGVGKELVARALHRGSDRRSGPFIEINCAAMPDENLFLSELFGHEKGAFTGALGRKRGQFELADGGTLFFDEVGELGPMAQARLLRCVETLQFNRVGGERQIRVNSRLIFATNRELEVDVEAGRFRRDLFYRINVCPIQVPPLRAHPEDVPLLARFFVGRMTDKHGLAPVSLSEESLKVLQSNAWPGNIRELRNVIERLAIRFAGKTVSPRELQELNISSTDPVAGMIVLPPGGVNLLEVEKSLVVQALQQAQWSQRKAAHLLGISVDRINARVKKFGLTHPSWRVHKS